MKTILTTLVLVSIAILIGATIKNDPGHIIIDIAGKTIDTTFAFFTFIFIICYAILSALVKMALFIFHMPEKMSVHRKQSKSLKARKELNQGLIDLAEGKWVSAERSLSRLAHYSDAGLINYLAAARAAQHQNAHSRRDQYLKRAIEKNPQANIAVGISQAELQISHDQIDQALATLNWLQKLAPDHIYVKKLLLKIHKKLKDWPKVIALLPEMRKHKLISVSKIDALESKAYLKRLDSLDLSSKELMTLWKAVPDKLKDNKDILFAYCQKLLSLNDEKGLEQCIEAQIENHWDERIIRLYGLIKHENSSQMLTFAETLLAQHDKSPMLFLTLGRLCMQRELWGKAKIYFQQSLAFEKTSEAYRELAELHTQLDEKDDANAMYKAGLNLMLKN